MSEPQPQQDRLRRARAGVSAMPLRVRLVALSTVLVTLGLVVAGAVATTSLRGYLYARVDDQLQQAAQFTSNRRLPGGGGGNGFGDGGGPPSQYYTRFADAAGNTLHVDDNRLNTDDGAPKLPTVAVKDIKAGSKPFTVGSTTGGTKWRVVEVPATITNLSTLVSVEGSFAMAAPLDEVSRTVGRLIRLELIVGAIVLVVLIWVSYVMVRRSLRPLLQVEHTAEAIAAGDMSLRVPEHDPRTEVGSLSQSFNTMLTKIESAFREREASEEAARTSESRMRRFVADASHELRTPLTSIRGFAELHRQGALRDAEGVERAMGRIEGEATRMGVLVDDLLLLARLDQQRPLEQKPVDLAELVGDAVHSAQAASHEHSITYSLSSHQPPVITGDAMRLRQVISNLLSNAVNHTPAGTAIEVVVRTEDSDAVVEVRDHGPGLPPEEAARVFERFYRADSSRTKATGGSGLGLSIVSSIVAAHGGRVELETEPGTGATFRVILPLG